MKNQPNMQSLAATENLPADKGVYNGSCNRKACLAPGATWYNLGTRAYYCGPCAALINWPGGRADALRLHGTPLLCSEGRHHEA